MPFPSRLESALAAFLFLVPVVKPLHAADPQTDRRIPLPPESVEKVENEAEFAAAIADPNCENDLSTRPFVVTRHHDFGRKHLVLVPKVLDFSGGSTLRGSGSISRIVARADYPVFVNARVGFWEYYSGRVTYNGTNYAPLPGQGSPPSVEGSWNNNERDVTYWKQWHDGPTARKSTSATAVSRCTGSAS